MNQSLSPAELEQRFAEINAREPEELTAEEAAALAEEHLGMKAAVVEAAIPNMGLTFKSAQDARGELDTFYNLLNDFDPSMIGGKLPNDGLYYAG